MDHQEIDNTHEMVKMTIKRADQTEDEKWICKRIDDDPESKPTEQTGRGANESLPSEEENLNKETADSANWYHEIPSYLEIEMKEPDNPQPSWKSSTKNNKTTFETQHPTYIHQNAGSPGHSCTDPIDLSASYSNRQSQRDATNNVSFKSPIEARASNSECPGYAYADIFNTPGVAGPHGFVHGATTSHFPSAVRSQNPHVSSNQSQINPNVATMPMINMVSPNQNFSPIIHRNSPVSADFVNSQKQEFMSKANIRNHLQQETSNPLTTNYKHCNTEAMNYGHSSHAPDSGANRSYNWPLGTQNNSSGLARKNERLGDNFANNLPLNQTNDLKRISQICTQIGSDNALDSARPPKKQKKQAEIPCTPYHCKICDVTYKRDKCFHKHLRSAKHQLKVRELNLQQSNLYNFQPNSASSSFVPPILPPQLHPHLLYAMRNQMLYHQMLQAQAMAAANHAADGRAKINTTDIQKSHPGTSKSDCNTDFLGHNRSQNVEERKCHPQNPKQMNLPINLPSNPQGIYFSPGNPHLENSMMVNPNHIENKESQSDRIPKNPSSQIQPENSSVRGNIATPGPSAIKPNPLEDFNVVGSSQKSGDAQSVSSQELEFFRVYHCLVCAKFNTNFLQDLELHVSVDRTKTPHELITVSENDIFCLLCNFKAHASAEMSQHFLDANHLNRVEYYNHVMEGGSETKEKLENLHVFSPVYLLCSACEFTTRSMDTLKDHSAHISHQHNVSCCLYASKFSPKVEYCYCRPCRVRTSTKRELLLHARSEKHMKKLRKYASKSSKPHDPAHLFSIKELSSNENELPRHSEQSEGSTCIGKEKHDLRKEKNDLAESSAPLDLRSLSSTSLKPLSVSCILCQQVLPEVNVLVQHLQRIHGVSEAGVKWLVATTIKAHEEKLSPTEDVTNQKAGILKGIVSSPQKSSATDDTSPIQGMRIDSSSYQRSVASGQNVESKSTAFLKTVASDQNVAIKSSSQQVYKTESMQTQGKLDQNPEGREGKDFSSSVQLCKTERVQNPGKIDRNLEGGTGNDFSSSQQPCETERMQNPLKSSTDSSANQLFYDKGVRNSCKPNQNPDFDQESVNVDSLSSQQFYKKDVTPVREEKVSNSEEIANFSSSPARVIVEYESGRNVNSRNEAETDDSLSEHFSATEHRSPLPPADHNASRERNDSSSSDLNTVTPERLLAVYDSSMAHTSPKSRSGLRASRDRTDSSSSDCNSVSHERLQSMDDSSSDEHRSPISQSRPNSSKERIDSSSSYHNSVSHELPPSTGDCARELVLVTKHELPKSESVLKARRRKKDSSDDIFADDECLPARAEMSRVNSSPSQHYVLDSENRRSPSEDQQNFSLRENLVNDCPTSRLRTCIEPQEDADNISVMNPNSDDSENGEVLLNDCLDEYEAECSAPYSPITIDPQIQASKNVENIEISEVFSLINRIENSSDSDEDESLDFENIVFSDQEDL